MDTALALELLTLGDVVIEGRMPWSSNATFLVDVCLEGTSRKAIYKPQRGERPLWDFPAGLYRREVAAYRLSEALGFGFVPPTVEREGPLGEGSLQLFVEADHQQHYFTIFESHPHVHDQLRNIALFDVVANNTDRKSGHCLVDAEERIWGIDHGLCFAAEYKLRTVIWEFGGEPIPDELMETISPLATEVPDEVASLLLPDEVAAVRRRAKALVRRGAFPVDGGRHRYPWPLV